MPVRLDRPQGAPHGFSRLWCPKKPLRCSLARFFRPLRSQSFGFIARRARRTGFPACGARKNLRAVRLLGFFDHCALSRSASSPAGRAARVFPLVVPKADGRSCSSLSALTAALSVSPLFPPQAARRYFVRLWCPKKPSRCSLARFFRPLRSQPFGFIARRARRTASSYRTAAVCAVKALS